MKIVDYIDANIPTWALPYLVNGDSTGLSEDDLKMVEEWRAGCREALGPADVVTALSQSEFFTESPAFGLPTTCVEGRLVALRGDSRLISSRECQESLLAS